MEYLAAPSNRAGKGGRGVRKLWGINTLHSLVNRPPGIKSGMAKTTRTQISQVGMLENRFHHSEIITITIDPPIFLKWALILWVCCPLTALANEHHQPLKWTLVRVEDSKVIRTNISP